jgi:hypothetical protein
MARNSIQTVEDLRPPQHLETEATDGRSLEGRRDRNTHLLLLAWSRVLREREEEAPRPEAAR